MVCSTVASLPFWMPVVRPSLTLTTGRWSGGRPPQSAGRRELKTDALDEPVFRLDQHAVWLPVGANWMLMPLLITAPCVQVPATCVSQPPPKSGHARIGRSGSIMLAPPITATAVFATSL